mgnify:FL=1
MAHRIAILGQPRTGTTALFYRQKAVLPATTRCLFEPSRYVPDRQDAERGVLIKMLMGALPGEGYPAYDSLRVCDRLYGLVRDPRDRIVSAILFLMHWAAPPRWPALYQREGWAALMQLLREKEHSPNRIPFAALFEEVMWLWFGLAPTQAQEWWYAQIMHTLQWYTRLHVTPRWYERLENTRSLVPPLPLAREHWSILRSGSSGEWRQWFRPSDEAYFRPLFHEYMEEYGYPEDWSLAEPQVIHPGMSSRYVLKWARVRWLAARRATHGESAS